jgi:predicted ATP-grasp superfamily ATP-dependent carboligase
MFKILLTNGAYKQTLAIARSLGAAGYEVGIVSHHALSVSFFSKYCRYRHIIAQTDDGEKYVTQVLAILKKQPYDIVLPVGYPVTGWLAEHAEDIRPFAKLPLAELSAFKIFENKQLTHDLAQQLGIPVPKTFVPTTIQEATECLNQLDFPIVFKKVMEGKNRMAYAQTATEFYSFFEIFQTTNEAFVVQEFISGQGAGYFALYDKGRIVQDFMHVRLREYPVEGGASCFAESIDNEQLRAYGQRILNATHWHGVAMVEFKYDAKGQPRLLEVNPKFWGSYDLCVAAGADFAVPYIKMTLAETLEVPPQSRLYRDVPYKRGVRLSWLMNGDLLNGIERGKVGEIMRDFFKNKTHSNLTWRDPCASLFLILSGSLPILKALLHRFTKSWRFRKS